MEEPISFLVSIVAPLIWYLPLLPQSHSVALGCQGRAQHLPGVAWVWGDASLHQQWPVGHRTIAWPELITCNGHRWESLEKSLQDVFPGAGEGCGVPSRQGTKTSVKEAGQDKRTLKNSLKNTQVWTERDVHHHNHCTSPEEDVKYAYDTSQPPAALFLRQTGAADLRHRGTLEGWI